MTTFSLLLSAKHLQAIPHTRLYGELLEKFVASGTNGFQDPPRPGVSPPGQFEWVEPDRTPKP